MQDALSEADVVHLPVGGGGGDIDAELARRERNDLGNADRLLLRRDSDMLFVRDVGWHIWTGSHWEHEGAEHRIEQWAHETARLILNEAAAIERAGPRDESKDAERDWQGRIDKLRKWSYASGNQARLKAMIACAAPYVSKPPSAMDADPNLLNVGNGTLLLDGDRTEIKDHDPADLLAKVMDVDYEPGAECPQFIAFLTHVQPDPHMRAFLQAWAGYSLSASIEEQKLVFFFGDGSNGKSVFVELMARLLGPYSAQLDFKSLVRDRSARSGADATPDLAKLPGVRMVRASEPEKGAKFAEALIKQLTGGEPFPVRHLSKGFFDLHPVFKLMLSGNHLPIVTGGDRGIWRRLLLVPWRVIIPENQEDRSLVDRIWAEERSGLLNWALDGYWTWREKGLVVPEPVREATGEYRESSDPVRRFIADCVAKSEGQAVEAQYMYEVYTRWCRENSEDPIRKNGFGRALTERGLKRGRQSQRRSYVNVTLVNIPDPLEPGGPADG